MFKKCCREALLNSGTAQGTLEAAFVLLGIGGIGASGLVMDVVGRIFVNGTDPLSSLGIDVCLVFLALTYKGMTLALLADWWRSGKG